MSIGAETDQNGKRLKCTILAYWDSNQNMLCAKQKEIIDGLFFNTELRNFILNSKPKTT